MEQSKDAKTIDRLSRDEVVGAFRVLLGRDPENVHVLESHRTRNLEELRVILLRSEEFAEKYALLTRK
jgi:hypothetical protein